MATAARVLWTKQVRKKAKTYNDGFLLISASGKATLYDENGETLSTSSNKLPYDLAADPAGAENLTCFEGYLVQGDSVCQPSDIPAARGCSGSSPEDSNVSTSTARASTAGYLARRPGFPQKIHAGVLQRGCAGMAGAGNGGASAPAGRPKAPMLGSRKSIRPHAGAIGTQAAGGTAPPAASATSAAAHAGSRAGGPGVPFGGFKPQQHQQQGLRPGQGCEPSSTDDGGSGGVSTGWGAGTAAVQDAGQAANSNITSGPSLHSDTDILNLLDMIAPTSCDPWDSSGALGQQQQQQQQQQQYQPRPLPAVPQFGRQHKPPPQPQQQQQQQLGMSAAWRPQSTSQPPWQQIQQHQQQPHVLAHADRQPDKQQQHIADDSTGQQQAARQPWQQPKQPNGQQQQQQQWGHWQQQHEEGDENPGFPPEVSTEAAAAAADSKRSAAFQSARDAWGAPQQGANCGTGMHSSITSMPGRQMLQPAQPEVQQQQQQAWATWQQPQQQQQQQQQQQNARAVWGQPHPHKQLEPVQQQWGVSPAAAAAAGAPAPAAAAVVASVPRAGQQRAGFKMPRPAQPPTNNNTGDPTGGRPPHGATAPVSQQQQQQGAVQGYCYPGPSATGLQRLVQIPAGFSSAQQYVAVLTAALTEEVNLQLAEQARTLYNIVRQVQAAQPGSAAGAVGQGHYQQQQQQQQQQQRQPQGGRQPGTGPDLASRLQAACNRAGLHYHPGASLTVYNNSSSNSRGGSRGGGAWGKGKKRGRGYGKGEGDDEEGEEEDAAPAKKAVSMYLKLPGKLDRRHFRKHDLWVLSNNPLLKASAASSSSSSCGPYDRLSQPWTVLARACWHGPDRDGKMEVELLPGQQQQLPPHHKWQRQQSLTALQGPDVATDLQVADFIGSTDVRGWALLGCLLKPWQQQQQRQQPGSGAILSGSVAAAAAAADKEASSGIDGLSDAAESPGYCDGGDGGGSSSSQEDIMPARRRKCRLRQTKSGSGSSSSSSSEDDESGQARQPAVNAHCSAAASAGAGSNSDLEDNFQPVAANRPGKRLRRAAAAVAAEDADSLDKFLDSGSEVAEGGPEPDAAVPVKTRQGAQAAGDADATDAVPSTSAAAASAAQELLRHVVQRFRLNPAQAAVAAHIADWLPQLMQDVQQRQQQGAKMRGIVKPKATTLTANRAPSAAAAAAATAAAGGAVSAAGSSNGNRAPVCLIHGPFGSGKSTLLVALIHLLTGLGEQQAEGAQGSSKAKQQQQRPTPRILVAAHTNVAVDRVLLGLQEAGFSNMLRVGSLARIAKQLLGVSLHSADDSRDALSQLNGMLRDAAGAEEAMIRSEIAAIQAGAERRRRKTLSTTAVVGITCCSALQYALEGQVFDVVLLDEASQMTEPTSLVPLLRAKPRYLIAAGDPCQLPPVLASPTAVTPTTAAAAAAVAAPSGSGNSGGRVSGQQQQQQGAVAYGLLRPLFVRLTQMGHVPHLLTHQYRCHPMLSLLSNKHFYNSRLVDGVTAAQRGALVPGLPPLVMCDCQGGSSQAAGAGSRSSINKAEANLVAQLVVRMLTRTGSTAATAEAGASGYEHPGNAQFEDSMDGEALSGGDGSSGGSQVAAVLSPHQLGVICFFRGQAALIKQLIAADPSCPNAADVQVATVDSFQGAEKEVIILATTTTNPHSEFCSDGARLNVALTRARRHLVVVGAASVLKQTPSSVFRELVSICSSGHQGSAAFMHGSSLLQLLGRQQ